MERPGGHYWKLCGNFFFWISLRHIDLLAKTMFTIALSCSSENMRPLPPWHSQPSILCRPIKIHVKCHRKVYKALFKHGMQWMGTKKYWCPAYSRLHCTDFTVDGREKLFFTCAQVEMSEISVAVYLLTVDRGWSLCPTSLNVNTWFTTWSTSVKLNFVLHLLCPRPPPGLPLPLPLPLPTPLHRRAPPLILTPFSSYCKVALYFCQREVYPTAAFLPCLPLNGEFTMKHLSLSTSDGHVWSIDS